jgi:hypothetical protein
MSSPKRKRQFVILIVTLVVYLAGTVAALLRGYSLGKNAVVRCRAGHVFATIWIPGASLKALRLGPWRIQWCPVGRHVDLVRLVKASDLSESEREFATAHHDLLVP